MKVIFMGTPRFAVPTLRALADAGYGVLAVYTQPDRPKGRGQKTAFSPVKECAVELGLEVRQPERVRRPEVVAEIAALAPRVMVVVGYGQIIPQSIIDIPPYGIINVHASLLPKYRGAAPIQWAIARGEPRTGVTTMKINAGLDTGDMLLAKSIAIGAEDTAATLHDRLAALGAELIVQALERAAQGTLERRPQPQAGATYAAKIDKREAAIDWTLAADVIERRLRAFDPFPGATSKLGGETVKFWRARVVDAAGAPGEIVAANDEGVVVACGRQALCVVELQSPGGRRLAAGPFIAARRLAPGQRFGTAG